MRILVVSPYPPRRCGIGAYAHDQVQRLRAAGHEVTVLSPPDGDGDARAEFVGGAAFRRAAEMGEGFDRILVHFQPALYYPPRQPVSKVATSLALWRLVRRRPQTGLIVHEADPPVRWRPDYLILRAAFRSARRLWFHTDAERQALEERYGIGVRWAILPHMVAVDEGPSREAAREELGVGAEPLFLCAGFIQPSKGYERAVAAFAGLGSTRRPALYIVGSVRDRTPENLAYLEDLQRRCREAPGVTLVDRFVSDREFDRWVAAADWLVVPYRRSWSSGVLARAHALGTPAIVSAVGGLSEQAGEDDVVFEDDRGLAEAMRTAAARAGDGIGEQPHGQAGQTAGPPEELAEWDPEFQPPLPKKGRGMLYVFIMVSVVLAAVAQLTLKHGMTQVTDHGAVPLDLKQPVDAVRRAATNLSVLTGLGIFVLSAAVWLVVLSRISLSFAYPFVSLTYVLIVLFDQVVLHEHVSGLRWTGVAVIIVGILLISRTHQSA